MTIIKRHARITVPWHRFWVPLGAVIHCGDSENGFLTDPEDEYGKHANPNLARLVNILPETGALVLCGEPGIGKSTELASIRASVEEHEGCCWIIFREIADSAQFKWQTVEAAAWQAWRAGTERLTLVVDGVDEGLLRIPNFLNDLTALLRNEPLDRLRLILACRTAEWPVETGRALLALWTSKTRECIYELCPLRRKDADDAARAMDCDPKAFLQAVWERKAIALAARPVTLFFLLEEFREHAGLPATHRELYERGTANLAREVDPARLELLRALRKTEARVSDADRLRAAQRLATLLLLSGRSAVRLSGAAFSSALEHDLLLDTAGDGSSSITASALEEAVESALFTSLGERRFGFVHQTFAECLGAQHLALLPTIQLRRLLCQRDVREEHVIPQLAELAAWLAGMHPEFCEHLLRIEPEVLLRSDVAQLQGSLKTRLVAAILKGAKDEKIFDRRGFDRFFDGLKHPGLVDQLRPIIADRNAGYVARRIAFDIASHCRLSELIDDLLALVKNASEDQHLRDRAAYALEDIVPSEKLHLLEPLARGEVGNDNDDSIRGCALRRLVPERWKIRDALPFLRPPRNENLIGAYHLFLEYEAPKVLEDADVVPVLKWLADHTGCFDCLHPTSKLAVAAVARSAQLLDDPPVADAFVQLWRQLGTDHITHLVANADEIASAFTENREARRQFVSAFLRHPQLQRHDIYHLRHDIPFLRDAADLDWLLNELPSIPRERRPAWVQAIASLTWNPEITTPCWDNLLERIKEIPELASEFAWMRAWKIDEPEARKAKAEWLRRRRTERKMSQYRDRWARSDRRPKIVQALEEARAGEKDAWLHLWFQLSHDCERGKERPWSADVMAYPGWAHLTYGQRQLCRLAARRYLIQNARKAEGYPQNCHGALAGAAALWLCFYDVERDPTLRSVVAGSWINLLAHQLSSDDQPRQRIFALLYGLNPGRTTQVMLEDARQDSISHQHLFAFRNARCCWDASLSDAAEVFLDGLENSHLVISGIQEWFAVDGSAAAAYAVKFLQRCAPAGDAYPIGLRTALVMALQIAPMQALPIAEPMFKQDSSLARSVWASVCYHLDMDRGDILAEFDEQRLADLYMNLSELFPKDEDPPQPGGTVTPRMTVARIRDIIPSIIASRATEAGCRELLRLTIVVPKQATWLRWIYRDAVTNIRRNLWQPPSPEVVRSMLEQRRARMLGSDDDLSELVQESLARLQTRLTGQALPSVEDLWLWEGGGLKRKNFRPKDEEALSDYITRWLAEDIGPKAGVVVNREVQPRRGARTDVIVEATIAGPEGDFDKLTVVIEVKGCWHDAARTGLRSQLVDGYLRPHGWRCGIYLVGWFVCPQWENAENNLESSTPAEAAQELHALRAEFDGTASEFRVDTCVLDCALPSAKQPSR
jgi:hypothetical protein